MSEVKDFRKIPLDQKDTESVMDRMKILYGDCIYERDELVPAAPGVKTPDEKLENESADEPDEVKHLRKLLQIAYAIENPDEVQKRLTDYMPDEYKKEMEDVKKMRNASYRMSINSVFVMAVAVMVAVVTLIFSAWWSYVALGAGLVVIFLIRLYWKNYLNNALDSDEE